MVKKVFLLLCLCISFLKAEIFFLGDSLSDTGNLPNIATLPPYLPGRFSNGPVWTEVFAAELGRSQDAVARISGGNNYAFGGAEATVNDNIGLAAQTILLQQNLGLTGSLRDDLCVIWIGANDLLNGAGEVPSAILDSIEGAVNSLLLRSAGDFLFMNLPDLARIPQEQGSSSAALLTSRCIEFNDLLNDYASSLESQSGVRARVIDIFSIYSDLLDNPRAYGFFNTTDAAFVRIPFMLVDNPNEYISWDGLHPTAAAHRIIGEIAAHQYLQRTTYLTLHVSNGRNNFFASWIVPEGVVDVQVEASILLEDGSWQDVGSPEPSRGGVFSISQSALNQRMFYRLSH